MERIAAKVSVGVTVVVGGYIAIELWGGLDDHLHGSLADWYGYMNATRMFLATGEFYSAHQLAGQPYDVLRVGGQLYPPLILYLLVPFTALPPFLWWALPIGTTVGVIIHLRPAVWTWPLMTLAFAWWRTGTMIWFGNPGMWIVAALALALVLQWPGALVLLKPSLAPFALIGIRSRGWWIVAALGAIASIPLARLWLEYPSVLANARGIDPLYSLTEAVPLFIPIVAAAGRNNRSLAALVDEQRSVLRRWSRPPP